MTTDEVKNIIKNLAESQGLYGRLYRDLENNNAWEHITKTLNKAGCKNSLDIIFFFEC